MVIKFYKWLYRFSKRKYQDTYLKEVNSSDYKCHNCEQWYSVSQIDPNYEPEGCNVEFGWKIRCQNCGEDNYWNCDISMLPIACDEKGVPLK